jgi:N-sulfoglucosamine sulfohydrolase
MTDEANSTGLPGKPMLKRIRALLTALRQCMETMPKAQGNPSMVGRGQVCDNERPTNGDGFHQKFICGEEVNNGWVSPTDFEKQTTKR